MSWKVFSIQTDWTCGRHQPFLWVLLGTQAPHQLTAIHIKSYFHRFCVKKYILSLSQLSTMFFLLHFDNAFKKRVLIQTYWRSSFLVDLSWQPTITPARSNVPSITVHPKLYFCSFVLGFCSFFFVFLLILVDMFCNCIVQFLDSI